MIIGIFDWADRFIDDTTTLNGGSQTWLIEISKALSNLNIETHVFCNCNFHKKDNIFFIPKSKFEETSKYVVYDKFIYNRGFYKTNCIKTKELDIMLHDEIEHYEINTIDKIKNYKKYNYNDFDKVKNVYVLSEHSADNFIKSFGDKYKEKIKYTFNAIDQSLYKQTKKTNSMIWSSIAERGYYYFKNKVFPLIRKEIPDFTLYVCQYNNRNIQSSNGIIYLGRLEKAILAKYQSAAKLWCYPNLGYLTNINGSYISSFNETFCITAIENAFAGANIVCGFNGGLTTTLDKSILVGENFFKNKKCTNENEYAKFLASICIKILKNEIELKCDVSKYTWKNAATSLL